MHIMVKEAFHYRKPSEFSNWRLLAAGLCILIVNLTGFFLNNYQINALASLGVFTFLNYQSTDGSRITKRLISVGVMIILAHFLGMVSHFISWTEPLLIALIAFSSRMIYRMLHFDKPGDIFIILVAAVGTTIKTPIAAIPANTLYVTFGVVVSIIIGYLTLRIEGAPRQVLLPTHSLRNRIFADPRMVIDAWFYAVTLFLASYLNSAWGLGAYSWVTVSCSAILQGNTLKHIINRNNQRIIGTCMGLVVAALVVNIPMANLVRIGLIVILYMTTEFFMPRNYAIGIFFVTIQVMFQISLTAPEIGYAILGARFLGIFIGSLLGVISASWQYRLHHFYAQSLVHERTYDKDLEASLDDEAHQQANLPN
ncbi:hypothetical protein AWM75_01085 [Aerococcus urinaehominis]|uniref:Uncharacterized protein n=1 Tax=Aerococcus urinaehominis TaxID=128944 RepID=A0A0X8FJX2_9LACT|nr:FUSC family protein [Aerococcus urinaehominis]AMB98672.1 hypothetical protein AWM75_01085 [Aerococcus urinaehominis]SDL98063.1 Fusaric acid resistance protein-like [Aerococcus urinaehominis]